MSRTKDSFTVGTRVQHTKDPNYPEGVVVWKHGNYTEIAESLNDRVWSVHWSNGKRGLYKSDEIKKIPPKNIKKLVEDEINKEDGTDAEEII
jgi:hypothetical protein